MTITSSLLLHVIFVLDLARPSQYELSSLEVRAKADECQEGKVV